MSKSSTSLVQCINCQGVKVKNYKYTPNYQEIKTNRINEPKFAIGKCLK